MSAAQDGKQDQAVTLTSRCLCNAHTFTASVPASSLPLDATCCHCTSCRHATGGMHSTVLEWPGATDAIYASELRRFDFSARLKILFCGTCGTPMFFESRSARGPATVSVFTGTLANVAGAAGLIRIADHIFVGDTVDGGASMWQRQRNTDGTPARRFRAEKDGGSDGSGSGEGELLPSDWPLASLPPPPPAAAPADGPPTEVPVWCKCRGVDLVLRPDSSSSYSSHKDAQQEQLPFFVDRDTGKLLAVFDACDSCRLAAGADVMYWTFALLRHVRFAGDASEPSTFPGTTAALREAVSRPDNRDRDPPLGALALYESSRGVQRYFCGRCSATVFYACDARPDMVDVAVGLLESPRGGGARAEDVLAWALGEGRTNWVQDVAGGWREGLVAAAEREAERSRVERGLPVGFREEGQGGGG